MSLPQQLKEEQHGTGWNRLNGMLPVADQNRLPPSSLTSIESKHADSCVSHAAGFTHHKNGHRVLQRRC